MKNDLLIFIIYRGAAGYDRNRDRYGSSRPDPIEHRYNGNSDSDARGSSSINADGFITSYGGHESRYPTGGANRDRISVGGKIY